MRHTTRILIAVAILASGLALVPFVGLPAQAFGWQRYAAAYQPILTINHTSGQPGSYFRVTGSGFLSNGLATVRVNSIVLGTVPTNNVGDVDFSLSTNQASLGWYTVTVSDGASASVQFVLVASDPMWLQEGGGPVLDVPSSIAVLRVYLPLISR